MKEFLTCTRILNLMVILGFMANYMLRVNLSIAIVDMVLPLNGTENATGRVEVDRFDWDVVRKNDLLGSFFWGYILTDIIGGRLAELLGPRLIFGGGMFLASFVTLLTPAACYLSFYAVFILRLSLGLFLGVTYPSIVPLAVKWIPPMDRSKFVANTLAQGLGTALSLPVCGFLIHLYGWPSVFYVTGLTGITWSCLWFYLIYDSPSQHPRISDTERQSIEEQIGDLNNGETTKPKLPWVKLLTSIPVWAIIVAHGAIAYCQFVNITQLPTYVKEVLHFNVTKNGIVSSVPNLGQYATAILGAHIGDKLRKSGTISTIAVRRIFASISFFIPALLSAVLAVYGENEIVTLISLTITFSFIGFMCVGHFANGLDISPNFCGTIMGLATTSASAAGWMATKSVALITEHDKSFDTWKYVFWIMSAVFAFGGLVFVIFVRADVQEWNSGKKKIEPKAKNYLTMTEKSNEANS